MAKLPVCTSKSYNCGKICLGALKTCRIGDAETTRAQVAALNKLADLLEQGGRDTRKGIGLERSPEALRKMAAKLEKGLGVTELAIGRAETMPGYITTDARPGWSNGYLARLSEQSLSLGREFVEPDKSSLSRSGKGTKAYKLSELGDGTYEADSVARSYESTRKYFEVQDGRITRIYDGVDQVEKEVFNDLGGRRAAKKRAEAEQLAGKSAESGLPDLKGSEKQIAWALKIRDTAISRLDRVLQNPPGRLMRDMARLGIPAEDVKAAIERAFAVYRSDLLKETNASKWIDRRDRDRALEFGAFAIDFLRKNPVV